jgi:hypothetical protein
MTLKHKLATSSELAIRVLQDPDSELAKYFDDAKVQDFWLQSAERGTEWLAPWQDYQVLNARNTETTVIQEVWNKRFISTFPDCKWQLSDTHNGWQHLTQDGLMHLAHHKSESNTGVVIELVGQNESGWPSKQHRGKFIRDMIRMFRRRGSSALYGIITDLARVVVVKLASIDDDGTPRLVKTATLAGAAVKMVFLAFAAASPEALYVNERPSFSLRPVSGRGQTVDSYPDRVLGHGAQGSVYLLRGATNQFVKHFTNQSDFEVELRALQVLAGVPGVPTLIATDWENHAFAATPVCAASTRKRRDAGLLIAATSLVSTLQAAHANSLVHRDVRPSNILFDNDDKVYLVDWACSTEAVGTTVDKHAGTVYYAAEEVLDSIAKGVGYKPKPAHDLESLIYTMDDLLQDEPPDILAVSRVAFSEMLAHRKKDSIARPGLQEMLNLARQASYEDLQKPATWAKLLESRHLGAVPE